MCIKNKKRQSNVINFKASDVTKQPAQENTVV